MYDLMEPELVLARPPWSANSARQSEGLQRGRLYSRLQGHPLAGISVEEVDTHFELMPSRYWERVTKSDLAWGLEAVHGFLLKSSTADAPRSAVVADLRHQPERGLSKVMVCAWDRAGLLAKMAAAFSALRLNIRRAEVYTRRDKVVLDLFEVGGLSQGEAPEAERLEHLVFLLEGALLEPPRFVSLWAGEFHKMLPRTVEKRLQVEFDNEYSSEHTIVRVRTSDRLGLLHDLLQALADTRVNVAEATVETADVASDVFCVTDLKGRKISAASHLEEIRKALVRAVS